MRRYERFDCIVSDVLRNEARGALGGWRATCAVGSLLVAATVSVFLAGGPDEGGLGIFLIVAGACLLFLKPRRSTHWKSALLVGIAVGTCGLALLPDALFGRPDWKVALLDDGVVSVPGIVALMPRDFLFWWAIAAISGCVLLYLQAQPLEPQTLGWVAFGIGAVTATYAGLSILQLTTDFELPTSGEATFGFFPNRNHAASLLVFGSISSLGLVFHDLTSGRWIRGGIAGGFLALLLAGALLYSESRASVLLIPAGLVIFLIGMSRGVLGHRSGVVVLIFTVAAAYLFASEANPARDRMLALLEVDQAAEGAVADGGVDGERPLDFRIPIARDTLGMIGEFPVSGVGLGNFQYVFPYYRSASLTESRAVHPESDWSLLVAEAGPIPTLALLALVVVVVGRLWWARRLEDWAIRWGLVSAALTIGLHGLIDVPLHRVSLGWIVLIGFASAVGLPGSKSTRPSVTGRTGFGVAGIFALALGVWMMGAQWWGLRSTPPFLWASYDARIERLNRELDFDSGELVAAEAVRAVPMRSEPYLWLGAFLLEFEETEAEADAVFRAQRLVNPTWPVIAVNEAGLWLGIDEGRAAAAWTEAVRRAQRIDEAAGPTRRDVSRRILGQALSTSREHPGVVSRIIEGVRRDPQLFVESVLAADQANAAEAIRDVANPLELIESLPAESRSAVIDRWLRVDSTGELLAALETAQTGGEPPGPYWSELAAEAAREGNFEKAARMAAGALGWSLVPDWLAGPLPTGTSSDFRRKLGELSVAKNTVALRRMIAEAGQGARTDPDELRAAFSYQASDGNWRDAWRLISRAAQERVPGN